MEGKLDWRLVGRLWIQTNRVAIKVVDTRKLSTAYSSNNLYREARILSRIRHPHVVRLYETIKASYLYCLVLEYVSNRDLGSYLKTLPNHRMSEMVAWPLVRQLTSGLLYLHRHNIVHRDLKMENILMDDENKNIKIIDFGLSNTFTSGELLKTHCGSPEYAAPELFYDRHDYGPEVDAWSFGVIVFGAVVGKLPFVPGSIEPSKRHALLKMLGKGLTADHREQMLHLDVDIRGMLFQLIEPKPDLRLSMEKVAEHTWITRGGEYPMWADIEPDVDIPLQAKVMKKLADLHSLDIEMVKQHVSEYKHDGLSSQYNMLMDRYSQLRRAQNITSSISKLQRKVGSAGSTCRLVKGHRATSQVSKKCGSGMIKLKAITDNPVKDDTILAVPSMKCRSASELKVKSTTGNPIITVSTPRTSGRAEEADRPMQDVERALMSFVNRSAGLSSPEGRIGEMSKTELVASAHSTTDDRHTVDISYSTSSSHLLSYAEETGDSQPLPTPTSDMYVFSVHKATDECSIEAKVEKHSSSPIAYTSGGNMSGKGRRMKDWIKGKTRGD